MMSVAALPMSVVVERCRVAARADNGLVALGDSAAIAFYTADLRMANGTKTASLWALKVTFA